MMNTSSYRKLLVIFLAMIWCGSALKAQETKETILFTNVKVFNGVDEMLLDADVLVEGNLIKQVAEDIKVPKGTQVIDGGAWTCDLFVFAP
jgi:adenine deaminase